MKSMKNIQRTLVAPSLPPQRPGVINMTNKSVTALLAAILWAGSACYAAQTAPNKTLADQPTTTASANTAPASETNSAVASIAADLRRLKARIESSVVTMSNAVASTPALQVAKVKKLADEITELGTKDLGEDGAIAKQAESLIAKFNESVDKARKGCSDSTLSAPARDIYGQIGPNLERELGKLIEAKSTVARIRMELLRQAEGLRQSADAIGFAEHAGELMLASQAFRATLTDVAKFTEKIALLIQSVGRSPYVPIT